MKRHIAITIFCCLFFLGACDKVLDDISPSNGIPLGEAFESLDDIQNGLTGVYDIMQNRDLGGTLFTVVPDLMSENTVWSGGFPAYAEFNFISIQPGNFVILNSWRQAYKAINQINKILQVLETLDDPALTSVVKEEISGQLLFLRGVLYFELVRYFGAPFEPASSAPGIPIVTRPVATLAEVELVQRATLEAVYAQAEQDLQTAATLLPDFIARGRANKFTALGYLAKIAFQKRDYAAAAALCDQIIQTGVYSLTAAPADFFQNEGSAEEIWSVINTGEDNNWLSFFTRTRKEIRVADDLITNGFNLILTDAQKGLLGTMGLTATDLRYTSFIDDDPDLTDNLIRKYDDLTGGDDAPLLRLGALYLMQAEALARENGLNQKSIDLLNAIRIRALRVADAQGNEPLNWESFISFQMSDFTSPDELIESVIRERRVELAFEGDRFHDLMRLRRPLVKSLETYAFDDCRLRWPIPQAEMDANEQLVQNPCY